LTILRDAEGERVRVRRCLRTTCNASPAGHVGTRVGGFASAADSFRVTIYGRGGHASQPHRTTDPVLMQHTSSSDSKVSLAEK
jgi:metal-dependent amidase/aminoacylase/carboxypeptidase family protein